MLNSNRLIEQAFSVDNSIIKVFNIRFKDVDVIRPEICNGLHKCKIYKPTEEEKVSALVANAGNKLLLKKRHGKKARSWKRPESLSKSEPLQDRKKTNEFIDMTEVSDIEIDINVDDNDDNKSEVNSVASDSLDEEQKEFIKRF